MLNLNLCKEPIASLACPESEHSEAACSEARRSQSGNGDLGPLMTVTQDPYEDYSSTSKEELVESPTDADKVAKSVKLLTVDGDCWL